MNPETYSWLFRKVRPDKDQRVKNEEYNAGITLVPQSTVFVHPFQRAVFSVENRQKLPSNIFGYVEQNLCSEIDGNALIENFYIEKSNPNLVQITLVNRSDTRPLELEATKCYGGLVVSRFRKYNDRYFKTFKESFKTDVLHKGKFI